MAACKDEPADESLGPLTVQDFYGAWGYQFVDSGSWYTVYTISATSINGRELLSAVETPNSNELTKANYPKGFTFTISSAEPTLVLFMSTDKTSLVTAMGTTVYQKVPPAPPQPPKSYDIYVTQPYNGGFFTVKVGNGTALSSSTSAQEGSLVTLQATALSDYEFNGFSVTGATLNSGSGMTRTFTMPASTVSVSVTFQKK
jgi:hypothetical protein